MRHAVPIALLLLTSSAIVPAGTLAVDEDRDRGSEDRPLSVLFVGNSFTRFNNLPRMVRRLLDADDLGPPARVVRATRSGATLRRLWRTREVRHRVAEGGYTHVVIQGHSLRPVRRPGELREYARRFDEVIDDIGAKTVLYNTWARSRHSEDVPEELADPAAMQERVNNVYHLMAEDLNADLAPVGPAFTLAAAEAPRIKLRRVDGIHPTPAGTYLAACVFYRVLTGRRSAGLPYHPWPMREGVARRLQEIADRSGL
jgi:hypothetical protein